MAYFIIEINIPNGMPETVDDVVGVISTIIDAAGGRVVDYGIKMQILILIVEATSEQLVADLLEANAFNVGQIRHIFLLQTHPGENNKTLGVVPSFDGFFEGMDLHDTVAIEVYSH